MRWIRTLIAMAILLGAVAGSAHAEELTVGVFLPHSNLATNADRAAWADRLTARILEGSSGRLTAVRAQVFARRDDARRLGAGVDVLIADGLLAAELGGDAIAHLDANPAVGLFMLGTGHLDALRGKPVAVAAAGANDAAFFSNTALGGEVDASTWFSELRDAKDAASALNMVRTGAIPAAFAPVDHPAAGGLRLVHQGGAFVIGVVVAMNRTKVEPLKEALLGALSAPGAGGEVGRFRAGAGDAFSRLRGARGALRSLGAAPVLAESAETRLQAPPIRLRARGRLPAPTLGRLALPETELPETRPGEAP
jgi:hypothetical protein